MNLGSGISLADDEVLIPKIGPGDFVFRRQFVIARQRYIDPLSPQVRPIAAVCDRLAGQEGDICLVPSDRSDVFALPTLHDIRANAGIPSHIGTKQICKEA